MKAFAILPAAAAAILTLSISVASSQEACLKGYQACMDTCGAKPTAQMQDTCIQNCQTNNNMCSDRVFGARNGAVVNAPATAAAPAAAKDAMAKKERRGRDSKKLQKKEEAPAPAAEQQPEAAPAPAAEEQAPAK
jgi:hypothetical protein